MTSVSTNGGDEDVKLHTSISVTSEVLAAKPEHQLQNTTPCIGVFDEQRGLVSLSTSRGKLVVTLGFTAHNRVHLFPEEALFLLHRHSLELKYNEDIISLEQGFSLLISKCGVEQRHAHIYIRLRSYGYVVLRSSEWTRRKALVQRKHDIDDFHERRRANKLLPNEKEPLRLDAFPSTQCVDPDFVVWLPDQCTGFRRANPRQPPSFRVVCVADDSDVPTRHELSQWQLAYPDIKLRVALLDVADILFFDLNDLDNLASINS